MPYICFVSTALTSRLLSDLLFQSLNLTAQVCNDAGVLSNVVGHIQQVSLHLQRQSKTARFIY